MEKKLTTAETYDWVLKIANELDIHRSFMFCKCKSGVYLKLKDINNKLAGTLFNKVDAVVGTARTQSHNPANKTLTVTLYS